MTTRTIITSQPDVACDVCERRLLRGEHPDIFLAAGRRRVVCELCAPRAVHEGWRREADGDGLAIPALRTRRGRNLFERLRQVGRPASAAGEEPAGELPFEVEPQPHEQAAEPPAGPPSYERAAEPYDFLDGIDHGTAEPVPAMARERSAARVSQAALAPKAREGTPLERGLAAFNASEYPRRIAGIARSLGVAAVKVRPAENAVGDVVAILVAWELCWYRYEVDLDVDPDRVRLTAQGTELEELAREDRVANALADQLGMLSLAAA